MRYTREELIDMLGEKELDQIINECKLKRILDPENILIMKEMENNYGFDYLVSWSIYVLAFPSTEFPHLNLIVDPIS